MNYLEGKSFEILAKTGFDSQMLGDIQSWANWDEIKGSSSS